MIWKAAPAVRSKVPGWRDATAEAEVRFLGRSPNGGRGVELEKAWGGSKVEVARLRQVHGRTLLAGQPGACGEGDASWTEQPELALEIVTADCVPILLAGPGRVAAVHAGWRGFVAGVVEAALERFAEPSGLIAWIGPAIGPCCYEVGEEVAEPVVARSSAAVRLAGRGARPHLDLPLAVETLLRTRGVSRLRRLDCCTACHPDWLESYRRDGADAGRNRSLIWLRAPADAPQSV